MSRTRIVSLVLVNWRGVFYERYLMDPNVTALEGANGAGKTTVMIAAYVALLPDMSRLRFTTLGENSASGGDRGIWGRLGEQGRPSYTALELRLANGTRVVAGVRLTRKGEPTVEPTPFLIESLADDVTLQELLLVQQGEDEHVPELAELRELVQQRGATLHVFRAAKDYFAALFDRGVTPLRLVGEEDRNKFNEMLRTSMTGGISKTLTSELRSFVLKKETGLADTLTRMRANLDACRRSRSEVSDSRRTQREISGVYDAGTGFFVALVLAVREQAEERRRSVSASRENLAKLVRAHGQLESAVAGHHSRQEQVQGRQHAARASLQQATAAEERRRRALVLAAELATRDEELAELSASAETAQRSMVKSEEERTAQNGALEAAQDAYGRAAGGLAKLQDGLDELHRRARDYRAVHRSLDTAKKALVRPELVADECAETLSDVKSECAELDQLRARLERETEAVSLRRDEYQRAHRALTAMEHSCDFSALELADDARLHQRARAVLAELDRREATLQGLAEMQQERSDLEAFVERQSVLWGKATELGLATGSVGASDAVAARLELAEQHWATEDETARHHQGRVSDLEREHTAVHTELASLDLRAARFVKAAQAAQRVQQHVADSSLRSEAELSEVDRGLADEHAQLIAQRAALSTDREERLKLAGELDSGGASLSGELLRLRDQLSGELVAGRFEELPVAEAARMEARLGPLAHAIIVDDVDAAAKSIAASDVVVEKTVWLVEAGTPLEQLATQADETGACVVVDEGLGMRVTPVPNNPTLGRSARTKAAELARNRAEEIGGELEENLRACHRLEGLRRDAVFLREALADFIAGDPDADRTACQSRGQEILAAVQEHKNKERDARERAAASRIQVDSLRRLLGEAFLLDPPNYQAQAAALDQKLASVESTAELLRSVANARSDTAQLIDVLRQEPPTEQSAAVARARIAECEDTRDRLFQAREALQEVLANLHALDWSDAEATLGEHTTLVPALEQQNELARAAVKLAGESVTAAELVWQGATRIWQAADARLIASEAMRERVALALADLSPDEGYKDSDNDVAGAERRLAALDGELLRAVESGARDRERLVRAEQRRLDSELVVKSQEQLCEPAEAAWAAWRQACETHGLLPAVLSAADRNAAAAPLSSQLLSEARGKRDLLLDRLALAHGGDELVAVVEALDIDEAERGEELAAWLQLRDWMRKRVPAQIAEVEDPLIALERLREHLSVLETRLEHQETDLRGASGDVARGIDVQLRRARWQVHRLNEHLEHIKFGSIRGIRVQMTRVERMEQILRALRDGEAQELLFQASLPFEDALNEIFTRYGGGRTGGQRLLDYREYLQLGVEIRRQSGGDWEEASPTRLSTGEAIGVGAALMMVVLTVWERDANLLRTQETGGSLRFLFLDEANRLSKDNLAVLFELCRHLELQLLIAAPEVAHAEGNTTYRLVRQALKGGGEEVLVSGRRAVAAD